MTPKNILIVEDDAILLFVNERMVTQLGHRVVGTAKSGQEAIDEAKKSNPDLILMDIRLLGAMDGIEAMLEIRKFSNVPVIYVSGNSDPKTYDRAKEAGMLNFLIKPVSIEMLKEALE